MEQDYTKGHRQRLKERFLNAPEALPDYEILELLLFNAIPRRDMKPLAKHLINKWGNFAKVVNFDTTKLEESKLENNNTEITSSIIYQLALVKECVRRLLKEQISDKPILSNWNALHDYLQATMGYENTEHFRVLYLNTKNHLICDEVQKSGTIDQTSAYPREIVKRAIFHNAAAIILAHNHPSGVASPSKADVNLTIKIIEACKTIDVIVHDHVIVAGSKVFSFKSNNLF